jgi:hypothetical protein
LPISTKPTPVEVLWRAIFDAIRPPIKMSVSEWAERNRVLSSETSFQAGRWKTFCYQKEPQDAPDEPGVVETVLMWGAQLGKSEIVNNRAAFHMDADPGPQSGEGVFRGADRADDSGIGGAAAGGPGSAVAGLRQQDSLETLSGREFCLGRGECAERTGGTPAADHPTG